MKPAMFIGSSAEHLNLAYAAQENMEHDVESTVWTQGVFTPSRTAMASLIDRMEESDFGLFVFSPDDITAMRDENKRTVRDNVVFELGLFIGHLGPERCFIIVPRGQEDLHLPTDLTGLTPALFDADRQDGNVQAALGPACNRVLKAVRKLGPIVKQSEMPTTTTAQALAVPDDLVSDPGDCMALLVSWMGTRPSAHNRKAMRYDEVDRELRLAPGSARLYIEKAAERWKYLVDIKGKDVIKFKNAPDRDY